MPPTSTLLFPETTSPFPEMNSFSVEPQPGILAEVPVDTGAEQVRKRRGELMQFRYRTVIMSTADSAAMNTFLDVHGAGDVNFTFYKPYVLYYSVLLVGVTDGSNDMIIPWRALASYTDFKIGGTSELGELLHTNEYVTPTKEDRIQLLTISPSAGLDMTFENVYARRRYICRMQSWRRYPFKGGAIPASEFHPYASPLVPVFPMVYEFNFKEKG